MSKLIKEFLENKSVIVPIALALTFVMECHKSGICANAGAFVFEHRDITGQVFYL